MTTSGTATFNMEFTELAEEAWERAGRPMRGGYDLRTARRSMNLLLLEWQNRGTNLFTIDQGTLNLEQGVATYELPEDTVDLIDHVIRTGDGNMSTQADLAITRIDVGTYATIPNKLNQGRPVQIWIDRRIGAPSVTIWPAPDRGTTAAPHYVLKYWRIRRMQDAGSGIQTPDVNPRFLPALVAGLAYYIASKVPELMPRVQMLQQQYEQAYQLASEEDREKTPLRLVPGSTYR